ncbi:MAG: PPE domain-containing protein, partial [Mycobacterium sp.]|nr:PPE domain-containing protein [Mycobacterium sp.]
MFFLLPRPPEGELISHQFWSGPGSSSLHAAATNLTSVAQQVQAVLTGHQTNSGVMRTAWQGQTGELANAADTPQQVWLATSAEQLNGASAAAQGLATSFDTAQMATPHPAAFAANDAQYPIVVGLMLASLGIIWQPYVQNGMEYLAMTAMAEAADKAYKAASGTILGTMP